MIATITGTRSHIINSVLARRFIGGASWSLAGSVLYQAINLVTMLFVARILGKETYGQFVLLQSTFNSIGIFAGFGIGTTATRYVAAYKHTDPTRLGHILALSERTVIIFGVLASTGLMLFASWLATDLLHTPSLATPLALAAFAVLFSTLDGYQKSTLIGFESMRAYAIGTVAGAIISMPIMLIAASAFGLHGLAWALVGTMFIQAGISRYQVTCELKRFAIRLDGGGFWKEWIILRDFALPALLAGVMVTPAHWICQTMLAKTPNGYAEIALLGVAMQWFNAIQFMPMVAGRVIAPMLTEAVVSDNYTDSKRILILAIKANAFIALPLAFFISVLSRWILLLYGSAFCNGSKVLVIAVATAALLAIQTPVGNMVAATSRMWLGMSMNLGWALIYITTSNLLIDRGATGVIISLGLAYVIHAIWTFVFAYTQLKSQPQKDT